MNNPSPHPYLTSLLIDPQVLKGPLQPAAVLIQAGRFSEAHHLLLQLTRRCLRDPKLWLLLAWTSPSPTSALAYYRICSKLDPSNELARLGLTSSQPLQSAVAPVFEPPLPLDPVASPVLPPRSLEPGAFPRLAWFTALPFRHLADVHFTWIMVLYLLLLALAELVTTFSAPQLGLALHGLLLAVLFLHASFARVRAQQHFLFAVALAPLIRLLSLSMPLAGFQSVYWYAIIGLPLLLASSLVYRFTTHRPADVGLTARHLPQQLLLALLGLPLGWLEYQLLSPAPLIHSSRLADLWVPALILLVFTGFLEEFIFRGLMQRTAENVLGKYSIYWISLLFAVLHIGYRSFLDFGFVLLVGLVFAFIVKRTGSIWGVTLAHGFTNITLYLIVPLLLH